jgi:hypothetical protein
MFGYPYLVDGQIRSGPGSSADEHQPQERDH